MKTMKNVGRLKSVSSLLLAFVLILGSCSKSDEFVLSSTDIQNLNAESISDAEADDANDMSSIAVGNVDQTQFSGGRMEGRTEGNGLIVPIIPWANLDNRLKCAVITINRTNTAGSRPTGVITIDFDSNSTCTDARGNSRKGKIIIEYAGFRFLAGSTIKTTFDGYIKNGIKVDGIHTLANVTPSTGLTSFPKFLVTIAGGKLTLADGKTITRDQIFTREWQRASNPTQDKWVILKGSTANGKNKNDKAYTMEVTADLVYSRACAISDKVFIPVSGTKVFTSEGKVFTVDYGTGNCDNDITVTMNGVSKVITVSKDNI